MFRTNNAGRRQERVLGLNRYDIYNLKRKNSNTFMNGIGSLPTTRFIATLPPRFKRNKSLTRVSIPMRDILDAERLQENKRRLVLWYLEGEERASIEYEATSEQAAVEIVTKVKYFVVSPPDKRNV